MVARCVAHNDAGYPRFSTVSAWLEAADRLAGIRNRADQPGRPVLLSAAVATIILLPTLGLAACGSSHPNTSTASTAASRVSTNPVVAAKLETKRKAKAAARAHKREAVKKGHHTSSGSKQGGSNSITTSHSSTTTSGGGGGGGGGGGSGGSGTSTSGGSSAPQQSNSSKPKSGSQTQTAPTVAALPGPTVSGSSGGMRASLHGANHAPKAGRKWDYSVLATDQGQHPLSGTVDTEFALGTQVVGHESPPTHSLRNGRLNDNVTFPAQAAGIPLTFQVIVRTKLGSVTLDWPVKVQK